MVEVDTRQGSANGHIRRVPVYSNTGGLASGPSAGSVSIVF
jgi:hypothetical protein